MTVVEFQAEGGHIEQATLNVVLDGVSFAMTLTGHWSMDMGMELVIAVEQAIASLEGRDPDVTVVGDARTEHELDAPRGNPAGPRVAGAPTGPRPGDPYGPGHPGDPYEGQPPSVRSVTNPAWTRGDFPSSMGEGGTQ